MMEEQECCILGICCDPSLRRQALADKIHAEVSGINAAKALDIAEFIYDHYDLAPHGLFMPLADVIAAEAREYPYKQS
jgi:hypothetical protein